MSLRLPGEEEGATFVVLGGPLFIIVPQLLPLSVPMIQAGRTPAQEMEPWKWTHLSQSVIDIPGDGPIRTKDAWRLSAGVLGLEAVFPTSLNLKLCSLLSAQGTCLWEETEASDGEGDTGSWDVVCASESSCA